MPTAPTWFPEGDGLEHICLLASIGEATEQRRLKCKTIARPPLGGGRPRSTATEPL